MTRRIEKFVSVVPLLRCCPSLCIAPIAFPYFGISIWVLGLVRLYRGGINMGTHVSDEALSLTYERLYSYLCSSLRD
jgi:hypothetical protein